MSKIDLSHFLEKKLTKLNLNRSELALKAGMSRQTLYKLLNAEIDEAKISTLTKLGQALNLHPMDLLRIYFNGMTINNSRAMDDSGFICDVTFPDNSIVTVNQQFTKTWRVKNLGKSSWVDRQLKCVDEQLNVSINNDCNDEPIRIRPQRGLTPSVQTIDIADTKVGEEIELSVDFQAPAYPCTAISYWKSVDRNGEFCFPEKEGLSCLVRVISL